MKEIDNYFFQKPEPARGCLLFLRQLILKFDNLITEEWKYKMPFYYYNGKMLCYLWTNKKSGAPYLGLVDGNKIDHPDLIQEKRSRMKILLIDPDADIPVEKIKTLLRIAIKIKNE